MTLITHKHTLRVCSGWTERRREGSEEVEEESITPPFPLILTTGTLLKF